MGTKAKLTIVLKADETVVAESSDAGLWQSVLSSINDGAPLSSKSGNVDEPPPTKNELGQNGDKSVSSFARVLKVPIEVVVGAASPSRKPPYLELNSHCWAFMKKNTAKRGPNAISPTALAGTLLALWLKESKLDVQSTQALAADVLKTINVRDPNASRGVKNTKWLQGRSGGVIVVNPAEIEKAIEIARAFCTKEWTPSNKGT